MVAVGPVLIRSIAASTAGIVMLVQALRTFHDRGKRGSLFIQINLGAVLPNHHVHQLLARGTLATDELLVESDLQL